jgi:hypothetical protein
MTTAGDSLDLSSLPQADQDAIGTTLIALLTGFRARDADKLDGIYGADADWVNAFGSVKAPPTTNIRVLTHDVV